MKNTSLIKSAIAIFIILFAVSCAKKKDDSPTNNGNVQAKYYFNFNLDGVAKTFRSNTLQTGHGFDQKQIGGYILNGENVGGDAIGLTIWKSGVADSLSHTEASALQGKTIYYDDANYLLTLNLQMMEGADFENYNIIDEANHSFKVTITSVTLTGSGTALSKYNMYEVRGTCSGKLENDNGTKTKTLTNGEFYARFTKGIL